jgi:DNA-binding MarR family transcriptional regulator
MTHSRRDVRSLVAALSVINAGLERARRQRKGASTLSLLQAVHRQRGIRPSALAEVLQVHPSLITRQVRDLEDAGFVNVTADPDDRRSCLVKLLPAGTEGRIRLEQFGITRFEQFVKEWETVDVRKLTELLDKLGTSMVTLTERDEHRTAGRRWAEPHHDVAL